MATFVLARRDASRTAASKVHVIVLRYQHGRSLDEVSPDPFLVVQVVNGADQPIFDIGLVVWQWRARRRILWRVRRHDDWMTTKRLQDVVVTNVRAADKSVELDLRGMDAPPTLTYLAAPLMLVFRDGNGRRWVRWPDGELRRLTGLERLHKII